MSFSLKSYVLREYGSWSVLIVSFLVGLGASRAFAWTAIPLFLALAFLVNSKQALMKWLRGGAGSIAGLVFSGQVVASAVIMAAVFGSGILMLLPLLIFPAAYVLSMRIAGEHAVVTEILGFSLLSLAAVLAKFLITGGLDVPLFLGVTFYFGAGVFKIKILLLKRTFHRVAMVLYLVCAVYVYRRMHIPAIILAPLVDNFIAAVAPYRVALRTTGWIEVAKAAAFLVLFTVYY